MTVERWTDEMLDKLASSVGGLASRVEGLTLRIEGLALRSEELASSVEIIRDEVDGLRVTAQALLQVAAQSQRKMDQFDEEIELIKQRHAEEIELIKQRHAESDERFNILLEEVRYLIRGNQEN